MNDGEAGNRQAKDCVKAGYCSDEYIVCPVCGCVNRKPGSICLYCSNYLFDIDKDDE